MLKIDEKRGKKATKANVYWSLKRRRWGQKKLKSPGEGQVQGGYLAASPRGRTV